MPTISPGSGGCTPCAGRATGETLLHAELRADNPIVTRDGVVVVVDSPHAAVGAPWVDLPCMLPSVAMQGGPLTGFFVGNGREPDPPGLPTLRRFQLGQGGVAARWLRRRTGWA